jgi:hypothetical protein
VKPPWNVCSEGAFFVSPSAWPLECDAQRLQNERPSWDVMTFREGLFVLAPLLFDREPARYSSSLEELWAEIRAVENRKAVDVTSSTALREVLRLLHRQKCLCRLPGKKQGVKKIRKFFVFSGQGENRQKWKQ